MSEQLSRFVVGIEAVFFALPVTALACISAFAGLMLLSDRSDHLYEIAQKIVYALPVAPLVAGWVLIARFVIFGSGTLRSSSNLLWATATVGGALVLAAIFVGLLSRNRVFGDAESVWPWVRTYFHELAFGLPALVPLAHLAIERLFRKSSNNRFERSRVTSSGGQGGSR